MRNRSSPFSSLVCSLTAGLIIVLTGMAHPALAETSAAGMLPGERPGQRILLPNQWYLDPAGEQRPLGDFPMNMRLSPDGRYLVVLHCGAGDHELMVFATSDVRLTSRIVMANCYYGVAFSRDGSKVYVSGGESEVVYVYDFADGYLHGPTMVRVAPERERKVPGGIDVSPDGRLLAVTENWGDAVDIIDLATHHVTVRVPFEKESRPYDCRFSPDGQTLYVSLWGKAAVACIDVLAPGRTAPRAVATGDHPNEMALTADGKRLFVANANSNTVSVIDTQSARVIETLNTALHPDSLEGSTPNSLDISPDGRSLFVANADNNSVAVFDISRPGQSRSLGFIPVGW